MRKAAVTGAGDVVAALLASLCCVGPLLFVSLGVGAGLASTFEPLRPIFGVLMVALLGAGFRAVYGRPLQAATLRLSRAPPPGQPRDWDQSTHRMCCTPSRTRSATWASSSV